MTIFIGSALYWLNRLPEQSVDCSVLSPPYYGLRSYLDDDSTLKKYEIGLEATPEAYIENMVNVFRGIRRVLKDDGTVWLNLGDSYWHNRSKNGDTSHLNTPAQNIKVSESHARAGGKSHEVFKPKDLMMIPHRVAIALQMDGWWVRSDIVWHKPNPMPFSGKDRCTTAKEYVFLLTKSKTYFYDADAIKEPAHNWGQRDRSNGKYTSEKATGLVGNPHQGLRGQYTDGDMATRNKRDVWSINTAQLKEAHFAAMPQELAETCIKAGCPQDGLVLDPFGGAGTTALAAIKLGRKYQLIELNPEFVGLAQQRIQNYNPMQATKVSEDVSQLSLFGERAS